MPKPIDIKKSVYELICIKLLQIVNLLSDTDILNRNSVLCLDCHGNTTLGCSVHFS